MLLHSAFPRIILCLDMLHCAIWGICDAASPDGFTVRICTRGRADPLIGLRHGKAALVIVFIMASGVVAVAIPVEMLRQLQLPCSCQGVDSIGTDCTDMIGVAMNKPRHLVQWPLPHGSHRQSHKHRQ